MPITKEDIKKIATTACLSITEKEAELYAKQCGDILHAFSKLQELNTDNVQPALHPIPLEGVTREDKIKPGLTQEEALSLSKRTSKGYFVGPKTL